MGLVIDTDVWMLAAQSEIEKARLVTCDAAFGAFNTHVLWKLNAIN